MSITLRDQIAATIQQISDQHQWIDRCGGSLPGYVERYGAPGEARCLGDGGLKIWEADTNALKELYRKLKQLREKLNKRKASNETAQAPERQR